MSALLVEVGLGARDRRDPELARMKSGVLTELYAAHAI
ncbi:hypothetical protein J2S76_003062 [Ancylobacter vacuolatus]|uniref:Uncharacterized protein n=1 Tax=Ancylobacter vacuolatus TaxID=223389 RepID=A0ABU0DJZ0_9HYPH|nr:hypothetical protein [Ancylobacter vacuolatus]